MSEAPLLSIHELSVAFSAGGHETLAVDRVSFDIGQGETVALVGEIRLRQVSDGAIGPQTFAVSRGVPSLGQYRLQRPRSASAFGARYAPGARR